MRTLSAGLDYYKLTMSQFAWKYNPDAVVTFTLKNRGTQRLRDYVNAEELQRTFDTLQEHGFSDAELVYFLRLRASDKQFVFHREFVDYLRRSTLPRVHVEIDSYTGDLAVTTTGPHALVTFWETIVMAEINEAYFKGLAAHNQVSPVTVYAEGMARLAPKIEILKSIPGIKFSDFGTRRHYGFEWQTYVVDRVAFTCPGYSGTSNLELSSWRNTKPIGTFAHEMPMVLCALADARSDGNLMEIAETHDDFLKRWYIEYGDDLAIALTDTFTDDFFFDGFFPTFATTYRGVRHDSGDPFAFGERVIGAYSDYGIDPKSKTIVFSDGLDIDTIVNLYDAFAHKINVMFGWGTSLTNDVGVKPLNIVMKATYAHDVRLDVGAATVKLSNDEGKHTGPADKIALYQNMVKDSVSGFVGV